MLEILSIENKSEVSMIPAPVVEFFNIYYGIDVSGIEVVYEDMCTKAGYYNKLECNTIHVSNNIKGRGLVTEMVIAHEINHLLQYKHNKALTINKEAIMREYYVPKCIEDLIAVEDIDEYYLEDTYGTGYQDVDFEYWNLHVEIDSRLTEALYIYTQVGKDGLDTVIDHVFNCGLTSNLFNRINNVPDNTVKALLLDEFNRRKEIEDNKKEDPISDEELDLLVKELFA